VTDAHAISLTPRQEALVQLLDGQGFVRVQDLAMHLRVNPITVRRDLKWLRDVGLVERLHGGCRLTRRGTFERGFAARQRIRQRGKRSIGERAAGLVRSGQSVLIDTGTTPLAVATALAEREVQRITVITPSLPVLWELYDALHLRVIALGGEFQRETGQFCGPLTESMLGNLIVDMAFIGADAIDPSRGFATADPESARIVAGMWRVARQWIIVADGSKVGASAPFVYAPLAGSRLITDRLTSEQRDQLRTAGVIWEETEADDDGTAA
jgi:DeoR family transcriptional regulator of aga operon